MYIAVIIVLYNPSESDIDNVRDIAGKNFGVIIDNSCTPFTEKSIVGNMKYICNRKNMGIAEAQNIAIREILKSGRYTHIVFLDQDSRVPQTYIADILREFKNTNQYIKLAIIGPTVINVVTGKEDRSVIHKYQINDKGFSERRQIISSGSCVSTEALEKIGFMDGRLFIDYVDFEWCWRASAKGYKCGISKNVCINHKVGTKDLPLGKYKIIVSSPFRYFYQYRNFLWLMGRGYVPIQWKLATGIKMIMRFIYFPFFVENGTVCWKYMCNGIMAGLKSNE